MSGTRSFRFHVLLVCFALWATPAFGARSSRDPFTGPGQGKLSPDLFLAVNRGDLAGVRSLLARGADPNARDGFQITPLDFAAANGQVPMVEALLHAGAELNATTPYGTALTSAAMAGSLPVIKLLLARGAD